MLAIVLRYVLFPKVRAGMTARYDSIQGDFEKAETLTASARAEVAEYDAQVASVRADAQGVWTLLGPRSKVSATNRLTAVNARIAEKRAAAAAEVEAARQAASSQVAAAVSDVAARAGELAAGKAPSATSCRRSRRGHGSKRMSLIAAVNAIHRRRVRPERRCGLHVTASDSAAHRRNDHRFAGLASSCSVPLQVRRPDIKKSFSDRTARIQKELDDSAAQRLPPKAEAVRIRSARATSTPSAAGSMPMPMPRLKRSSLTAGNVS